MLISAKVTYNKSYDTYLVNYKNIYRIVTSTYTDHVLTISQPLTQRILGKILKEKYPEVKESGFLCRTMENHFIIGENSFTNNNVFHSSNGFIKIFHLEIIQGNSDGLLTNPNRVIISKSFAKKYFNDEDPLGKTIFQYPGHEFEIEAVFNDLPKNSHITPDLLISFHDNMHLPPPLKENWGEFNFYTYLELDANADLKKLEEGIALLYDENNALYKTGSEHTFALQALKDIHTRSQLKNEISQNVRGDYLNILQLIGIFILMVSGFNYIYFSYARISNNSAQYGIRKALGANNFTLLSQFMTESLLMHVAALILSVFFIALLEQMPNQVHDLIPLADLPNQFWIILLVVFMASSILNPLVLLFMLSNKNSLTLLTQKFESSQNQFSFRQIFTIIQFVIIVFLITSILGIDKQVAYLKTKDKGIDISSKLVIKTPSYLRRTSGQIQNLNAFEQELAKIAGVQNVSISNNVPGDIPSFNFNISDQKNGPRVKTALFIADHAFLESYQIELVAGKGFPKNRNNRGCVINVTCMKQLGYRQPSDILEKVMHLQDESNLQTIEAPVIGVCKDFNFSNAKELPDPTVLMDWTKEMMWGKYTLTINPNADKSKLISQVESNFINTFPNYSFEYFWADDFFNRQFDEENTIISNLKNFAVLAILLGVLSLLSMAWHISLARTKEIGIRKVHGAKQFDIVKLLNLNFIKWILLASLAGIPLSWYFLSTWTRSFAYRANISIWIFLTAAGIALLVGILTITLQSLKVANMNPVDSIKYE
jgi:putative ABC transport system permease protein